MDLWQRFADAWYDALLAFDREFRVVAVNARGAELFGIPAAALAGRRLRDVAPQAAAALEPVVGRAFLEGRAFAGDARPLETSDSFTLVANVLRGGEIVAMNVHRQSDATWPTDGVWLRRELDFAHRLLHAYADNSSLAFVRWDENFRIVEWSPRAEAMFGWRFDEVCGRTWREIGLVHPDDAAEVDAQLEELVASANATVHVNRNLTRDGRALHCRWFNTAIRVDGAVHVVSLGDDVTDLFVTRATLTAQSDRLRELYLVAAASNAAAETQISATLDAGCRLLRMRCGAVYDVEGDVTVAAVGPPVPRRLVRLPLATEGALGLDDLRGLDDLVGADPGDGAPLSYIGTAIEAGGTRFGTLAFADAAPHAEAFLESDRDLVALMGALIGSAIERGRSRSRLNALAYTDPVTGLPNRAWFSERLHDELRAARAGERSVALMFLDLDRFKDINDTLGHALGDRLLHAIGERLRVVVGDEGLVARLGGDEFVVLAGGGPDVPQIDLLAQRIVRAIDQPVAVDGYEQFATTSVGIALFPADGDDADTLIKHADVAMYRAKERGRNTYQFYAPSMGTLVQNRIAQETLLRKGLERDEFVVHYQPQFDIEGTRLVALEALVRWQHPTLGLVQPDEFVPAAELSGLIVRLGDWVLETACRQIGAWQSLVPGLRVAVNLSGRQFHQNALDARIRILLSRSGLRPDQLELEITESVAMNDAALSVHLLEELGRAGVRLALDDFGTGYSSLGYLRRFPLDCIKIDKSFVRDVLIEPEDATIVRTVIAMAHSLGLEVCAEGVETEEQLAFLRAERCDRVQGFLFGQPMTAEETAVFLAGRGIRTAVG